MKTTIFSVAIAGLFTLSACHSTNREKDALQAQQRTIDSMNMELAKNRIIDSMNAVNGFYPDGPVEASTVAAAAAAAPRRSTPTRTRTVYRSSNATSSRASQPVVYQEAPAKKRGWSAKAKGAVIGAGTGAVAGAVINKRNRAAGAVIGGVLGAAAGTGIGAVIDKRNGR